MGGTSFRAPLKLILYKVRLNDGEKRNSVRITSQDSFEAGTMWVLDAVHIPYGCSVWPALSVDSISSLNSY